MVNAHTLSDFRVKHESRLKGLFVQVLGLLSADGLITLERVMQDGTKIRAKAAADSFRRKQRVEQALKQASGTSGGGASAERRGNERRILKEREVETQRERQQRLEQALEEFEKLAEQGSGKDKENRRVSTSGSGAGDEARRTAVLHRATTCRSTRMQAMAWS